MKQAQNKTPVLVLATTLILGASLQAATPVDPSATPEAKNLLNYIYSIYGKKILSGQQETNNCGGASNSEMDYLKNNTGKYPAIRAMDMNDSWTCGATQRAIDWWNAGGIVMFGWHWGAPGHPNSYDSSKIKVSINTILTTGTPQYASFIRRLDSTAVQFKKMQDAKVPIIWRPYHEVGTSNWFWWGLDGGANYVRLWKFMFTYYTQTKGLHNLVWLMPFNGGPDASFWPGTSVVDLAGGDTYASNGDHSAQNGIFSAVKKIVGNTMPIALHENGPIPDPAQLQSTQTNYFMFNTWNGTWLTSSANNTVAFLKSTYSNSYVITRDQVPNLKASTGIDPETGKVRSTSFQIEHRADGLSISCGETGCGSLSLVSMDGRVADLGSSAEGFIPFGKFRPGLYVLRVLGERGTHTEKILLDR